ncbi:dihydrolipoamide acetyltransferase family protein [Stappia sp.]|uniref:dihydrolipoamide acetyltransferase family protein n=1 Tax=Stappia sp. TaxID=1870903 RepID=UPI0032D96D9C
MGLYTITLPDIGEGIAEAELTEWNVAVGDAVEEDDVLGTVMTDKAAVEVPSTVSGKVVWLCGEPGDTVAVGGKFIQLEVEGAGNDSATPAAKTASDGAGQRKSGADAAPTANTEPDKASTSDTPPEPATSETPAPAPVSAPPARGGAPRQPLAKGEKPLASPAVRRRAQDAGIDLRLVGGSGPAGRILHEDLDAYIEHGPAVARGGGRMPLTGTREVKVLGMRRKIAEKMAQSWSHIPHITIVEEIDMEAVEALRGQLNAAHGEARGKLTVLPFLMRAIVTAVRDHPEMNAHFDDDAGRITQSDAVHVGIATQTPAGLTVPVVRHAEAQSLWESAAELKRLAEAARSGKAAREELSGSTITITSLGPLGAIATTPIINHPEVAIVGVNKMSVRPVWDGQAFQPRKTMNLSCSFDHRVIDGWDAAVFVQTLKRLIEAPALMFVEE